jgi:uncharacterized protein YheU (UPF0270 family)
VDDESRYVVVAPADLSPDALRGLIEEFVTREGTDYGLRETDLEEKVQDVERQLRSGEARIVYDLLQERANIVPRRPR